jgi:zinc transport system substrate-binding protein
MQAEEESQSSDETDVVYDEHIWLSPLNAIKMADAIAASLTESDPAHAPDFESHRAALDQKLQELDQTFRDIVKSAKRKTIIVGDRFPFRYLTEEYGLEYYAAFPGCSAEVEPSASTVAFLIDKVKTEKIPVVFYIEFSTHKIADAIADATGAKTMLLHSAHNVSQEDIDSGITYLSIMTENAEKLREALN